MGAHQVLALADDLTGALEIGARFEGAVVCLRTGCDAGVLVIDTESRHLPPRDAAARVRQWCEGRSSGLIYKKTDSTLRGNIGAELGALPPGWIHYVPAYPALGRTVRNGRLFVDGVPVEQSAFSRDPLEPVTDGRILNVLESQGAPLERIRIYDGETGADIRAAAGRILSEPAPWLAAGPAALAGELAGLLGFSRTGVDWPVVTECMVINGSAHPASAAQIAYAAGAGMQDAGWRCATIADALAAPGALTVFGGDTARAVLAQFGDPPLYPLGEVLPGVPVSRFEARGGPWVLITKAGGFGAPDLLVQVRAILGGRATHK